MKLDVCDVRDFTGSTTERMQKWGLDSNPLKFVPPEDHLIDAPILVKGMAEVFGVRGLSRIVKNDPQIDLLTCDAEVSDPLNKVVPITIHDITFDSNIAATTGYGLRFSSSPWWRWAVTVEACDFRRQFNALSLINCAGAQVHRCIFWQSENCEIDIDNTINADAGDNVISLCSFADKLQKTPYAIYQRGGGGTRLLSNKMLWYGIQYCLDLPASDVTNIFQCVGGSYEGARKASFRFGGAGKWFGFQIVDTQMDSPAEGAIGVLVDGGYMIGGMIGPGCDLKYLSGCGVDIRSGQDWSIVGCHINAETPFRIDSNIVRVDRNQINGVWQQGA